MHDQRLIKPYQAVLGLIGCAFGIALGTLINIFFIIV